MASTSERNQSESDMDCDEVICDLSDTSDTEIYSYHDTDSEQNSEADEELPNDDSEFYFGKDGPKSEAKSIESESDAFTKIIDNDMVQKIVDCTNAYISNIKEHFSRERDAKLTTVTEILALFGLLIMSGVKRAAHLTYKELWAVDGSGVEIVRAIMSQERFLFLLRCLRFDYITTRKERKKLDKLAPIREFVEAFVYNCKKLYTPGENNTIDEKLIPFRGSCGFRQYMPNKPAKYGLKFYTICDARTFYTFNFEIYCGKQPDGSYKKKEVFSSRSVLSWSFYCINRTQALNEKHHSKTKVFVHKDLKTCSHVFLRTDRVKKALEPPYEGPFQVLRREEKYFIIKIKNKEVSVSKDRLKPAYLLNTSQPEESAKDNTSIRQPVEPPVDIRRISTLTGRTIKPPCQIPGLSDVTLLLARE
ncbi:hypothetical protein LAZ67_3005763 [Cordylochernes scorpioides]|uniref:PiggyBac transposable element-derived protein domain-containing protein n=1 Tax=Cordylochernes scorpioides TaxID=51811 RepID=A0ABY6KAS6_9ARAC|nr:hypothetical protein LAZ67_3005763 [Cordylochernes scorpioides]